MFELFKGGGLRMAYLRKNNKIRLETKKSAAVRRSIFVRYWFDYEAKLGSHKTIAGNATSVAMVTASAMKNGVTPANTS